MLYNVKNSECNCRCWRFLYTAVAASFGAGALVLAAIGDYIALAVVTCLVAIIEGGAHSQRATCVNELVKPAQMALSVGLVIFAQGFGNFYGPIVGGKYMLYTPSPPRPLLAS